MIEIGPNLASALKFVFVCLLAIAFCRYVIGNKA